MINLNAIRARSFATNLLLISALISISACFHEIEEDKPSKKSGNSPTTAYGEYYTTCDDQLNCVEYYSDYSEDIDSIKSQCFYSTPSSCPRPACLQSSDGSSSFRGVAITHKYAATGYDDAGAQELCTQFSGQFVF